MTREEAIEKLELLRQKVDEETYRALILAIKALEQEPCTDAVSRQAVLDLPRIKTHNEWGNIIKESVDVEDVRQLPSVTQKSGKWIEEVNDFGEITNYHCSKCYEDTGFTTDCKWKFCPNCGARMESEE